MRQLITKSKDNKHLYIRNIKTNVVRSYQLLKCIARQHYLYILSHVFDGYIDGMFGKEIKVTNKVERLECNIIYVHKPKKRG